MLLNRTRAYNSYEPGLAKWITSDVGYKEDNGSGYCAGSYHTRVDTPVERQIPLRFSHGSISDYKSPIPLRHLRGFRKRHRGAPYLVKDVVHHKVSLDPFKDGGKHKIPRQDDVTFEYNANYDTAECRSERTVTMSCSPLGFLCYRYGSDFVRDQIFANFEVSHPGDTVFQTVDWAAIADAFDERCKSLIPSSFFLGESMYESSIFKNALLFVANPSRSVGRLIKDVQKRGLHRLNMGKIANYYRQQDRRVSHLRSRDSIVAAADRSLKLLSDRGRSSIFQSRQNEIAVRGSFKDLIDLHLSYKFGVKPAIDDLKDMFSAHSEVEGRLAYLSKHRGQYVPIRASRKLPASFSPGSFPPTGDLEFSSVLQECYTKAVIFGLGKVRNDIHEASRWRAYTEYFGLNKVIGLGWELVPFSFVVDWFTNSQEVVNKLTRIPLGESPFMNLACIGHSYKNVSTFDYVCNPGFDHALSMSLVSPDSPFPICSYSISDYTRQSGFPNTSLFDSLSNFGLFQGVTGSELLLQKFL